MRGTEDFGTVVLAGDLFENERDTEDVSLWRDISVNCEVQQRNRDRVLKIADYIVPGHGPPFKVSSD